MIFFFVVLFPTSVVLLHKAETHEHISGEAADVIFFALTACAKAGVDLVDVERVLDYRHLKVCLDSTSTLRKQMFVSPDPPPPFSPPQVKRRPGNAKPQFIASHMPVKAAAGKS